MSTERKELNSNFYANYLNVDYLSERDKYLFKKSFPKYKFNVIGAGMIGLEHIKVTMLEGRGTVHGIYDIDPQSVEHTRNVFSSSFPGHDLKV